MDFDLFKKEKQENKKFTNCYLSNDDLQEGFSNNQFETYQTQSNAVLLLEKTRYAFYKLLFFSKDILKIDWKAFSDKKLVLSIILRKSKWGEWAAIIDKIQLEGKYNIRGKFVRMVILNPDKSLKNESYNKIKNPEHLDFEELQKLLEQDFDVYAENIPSIDELKDFRDTTYIIKENNKIAAFFICQNIGKTTELRFWLVLKEHRGKGYGSLLLKYSLAVDQNINRFFLWANSENTAAMSIYDKMGFKEDDILNCVLVNENIKI
jgi:ribosomal protein S18 acetylase RimI-like enzyme|nr:GNAT family N-acetyltransferase [uncultured Psychroserpens sp.]